ncbi:MAG: FIST C-terminal domain-containing protein [Proteobacteria bacterium]|nr:FIST C-terminal domain-containing protein [Pseudomonadota bacterium]MBU4297659.1 FIST C-terminal domain-containing protein [Pseudomonadota bacterium]
MKVGIGYCNNRDAFYSGRSAASNATRSGDINRHDLAIAFCSGQLDHEEFLRGIKEIVGDTPVIGGSSIGVITNNELSYSGSPSVVALFQLDGIKYQIAAVGGLDSDENLAGCNLAAKFSRAQEDRLLLMFYDSIKAPASPISPPIMNASNPLIAGIESILQSNLPIIGAGLIGDYQFSKTKQFCSSNVSEQSVVGALISGSVNVYHAIMHGCSPLDGRYRKITKIQGSVIYELDGKPIVEVIDETYGNQDWKKQHPLDLLTIGVNYGDRFKYQEAKYVNRLITGILPDGSGIGIFEPDLEQGMEIQFMLRDGNKMIESARNNAELIMKNVIDDGKTPVFALYIDCAGRAAELSNTETEEAAEIQQVMNRYSTPLLGFYSGVEVAPILGKSRGLDWTGVLMVLAKDM